MKLTGKRRREGRRNNLLHYIASIWRVDVLPRAVRRLQKRLCLRGWERRADAGYIRDRVAFYCQVVPGSPLREEAGMREHHVCTVGTLPRRGMGSHYYYDMGRYLKASDPRLRMACFSGDTFVNPQGPTLIKTRRLDSRSRNCVLLNLDCRRHFMRPADPVAFADKKGVLFFRGAISHKPHRIAFFKRWAGHPLFDLGDTSTDEKSPWSTLGISITGHFDYKYILCLEGNDVASALQWVMASECVPVMPRPTVEGWLMHSRLEPGVHYIEIASDYSDAAEKIAWYEAHPEEGARISRESRRWAEQFYDRRRENIISYLVVERYLSAVNGRRER